MTETPCRMLVAPVLEGREHLTRPSSCMNLAPSSCRWSARGPEIINDVARAVVTAPDRRSALAANFPHTADWTRVVNVSLLHFWERQI
jgi:hypothetical protein